MPSSWVAWSGALAAAVDGLDEGRLWPLADALTLPRALGDTALMHAVLELVAPGDLQHARTLAYLEQARPVTPLPPPALYSTSDSLLGTGAMLVGCG